MIHIGTSGWQYDSWRRRFYPKDLPQAQWLPFYAERFETVEVNNTFYRLPKRETFVRWREVTPPGFLVTVKASRFITHIKRLKEPADSVRMFYERAEGLGDKLGPVLFQLPPFLKKDLPRLADFLPLLPAGHMAAFEFRNDSWFSDDVYALLKGAGAALCLSEREDNAPPPLVETAPWGYVRLRLEHYSDADLQAWARRLGETGWGQTYVYFMHEPTAPAYAQALMRFAR